MALKLRLARGGRKGRPFYHMVAASATAPRDGRFVEKLGTYDPLLGKENPIRVVLNQPRIAYWLSVGAQPTDRVARLLGEVGMSPQPQIRETPIKSAAGKKALEREKERAAAAAKLAESHESEAVSSSATE